MPRDEWRRVRDRDVARRAEREIATGGLRSYEALSDEVTPLDKINILASHPISDQPEPSPPVPPPLEPIPRQNSTGARLKRPTASLRFPVGEGVSVLVNVDGKARMSVVQALEVALSQARSRYGSTTRVTSAAAVERLQSGAGKKPAPGPASFEPDLGWLTRRLKKLAEAMAAERMLSSGWRKRRFRQWRQELMEAPTLTVFSRLMVELELSLNSEDARLGRWKSRCQVWRHESRVARTHRVAGKLLAELAEVLELG